MTYPHDQYDEQLHGTSSHGDLRAPATQKGMAFAVVLVFVAILVAALWAAT